MTYFLFHLIPVVFFQREDGSLITSHGGFDKPGHGGFFILFTAFAISEGVAVVSHAEGIAGFCGSLIEGDGTCDVFLYAEPGFIAETEGGSSFDSV